MKIQINRQERMRLHCRSYSKFLFQSWKITLRLMPQWLKRRVSRSYYYLMFYAWIYSLIARISCSWGEQIGSVVAISSEPTPEQSWGGDLSSRSF